MQQQLFSKDILIDVAYIVDDNPKRQGLFTPGYGLEVKEPKSLTDKSNIILAWRHIKPISRNLKGNAFIPLPYAFNEKF